MGWIWIRSSYADADPFPFVRIKITVFPNIWVWEPKKFGRPACLAAHSQQIDDVVMLTDNLQ
jgi:hypothetical protein